MMKPVTRGTISLHPRFTVHDKLTVGQEGQGVCGIAGDAAFHRLDPFPLSLRGTDLQTGNVLGEQHGQAAKVGVAALGIGLGTIPFILAPDIVDHVPEMVVRVLVIVMRVGQVVLRQLEDDGDEHEELSNHLFPEIAMEGSDLVIVLTDNVMLANVCIRRGGFWNVKLSTKMSMAPQRLERRTLDEPSRCSP